MILRAAVVGCGFIGSEADGPLVDGIHSHAGAYTRSAGTTLVAVCDTDADKAGRCAVRWGAAPYQDYREMLAEQQPNVVSVCTPDETHFDVLKSVMSAASVRGVLAEKPLALSLGEAEEIEGLASKRAVTLAVNYTRRYAGSHRKLKEFIASGGIGEVQAVGGYYTKGIVHNGTHWFDLARFLVGDIKRVWGRDVLREGGPDPTLDALIEFENGAAGHLQACRAGAHTLFEMDLVGTRGRVQLIDSGHVFRTFEVADSLRNPGRRILIPVEGLSGGLEDALLNAVDDLAHAVETSGSPLCSAADAIDALKVALGARSSALSGAMVEIQ